MITMLVTPIKAHALNIIWLENWTDPVSTLCLIFFFVGMIFESRFFPKFIAKFSGIFIIFPSFSHWEKKWHVSCSARLESWLIATDNHQKTTEESSALKVLLVQLWNHHQWWAIFLKGPWYQTWTAMQFSVRKRSVWPYNPRASKMTPSLITRLISQSQKNTRRKQAKIVKLWDLLDKTWQKGWLFSQLFSCKLLHPSLQFTLICNNL